MDVVPSPTLWIELALAVSLAIAIFWTRPEFGLFLYGVALGFPDVAFPVGSTINLRLDDVILVVFLPRALLWPRLPASSGQKRLLLWQAALLAMCLGSSALELARGEAPGAYEFAKMIGCGAILLVLSRLIQSEKQLRFLIFGLMSGGIALAIQVFQRLGLSASLAFANFQELKAAATFNTWNPNTTGQAAILLTFAAGLCGAFYARAWKARTLCFALAMGFALLPAVVFARGTTISIAAGLVVFFCLLGRWKPALAFVAACLIAFILLDRQPQPLVRDATAVNLTTGEGFSHRFERWEMAVQAIGKHPIVGEGFGQEWNYLSLMGSEGRAHNAFLTVWVELGLGGIVLFLMTLAQYVRAGLSLYRKPRFKSQGALMLALIFTMGLDSLGLSTLYWEKLPTIALSIAIGVVGLCERRMLEWNETRVESWAFEPAVFDP